MVLIFTSNCCFSTYTMRNFSEICKGPFCYWNFNRYFCFFSSYYCDEYLEFACLFSSKQYRDLGIFFILYRREYRNFVLFPNKFVCRLVVSCSFISRAVFGKIKKENNYLLRHFKIDLSCWKIKGGKATEIIPPLDWIISENMKYLPSYDQKS